MCETASAVSSMNIGGGTATSTLQLAATAAVSSFNEAHSFNVITSRNTAAKNYITNNRNAHSYYNNQAVTTQATYRPTPQFIVSDQKESLSKIVNSGRLLQKEVDNTERDKSSEIVALETTDRNSSRDSFANNNFNSTLGFSTIINESDFPHLGVRWSPSLSGTATVDTLSSSASSANNYANSAMSMHGGLVSSTSANIAQQQTSLQNALFNRESGVHLSRPYANLIRDSISLNSTSNEFRIQNEDFPALPVSHLNIQHNMKNNEAVANQSVNHAEQEAQFSDARNFQQAPTAVDSLGASKGGIKTHADGLVTNIPANMLNDQYGMAGLLTFLRTLENDPSIVALALGQDLTNLGLNLNSPKYRNNLHQTFGGPWSDYPPRMQDLDIKVPSEYMTNLNIRDKLPNIKLNKFGDDVLFHLFYNCPGEVYQSAAAWELYQRDWRYHKLDRVWLTRSPFTNPPIEHTGNYEKASYHVFDPVQWRKIPKEMIIDFKELEGRPYLPGQTMAPSTATQQVNNAVAAPANLVPRGMMGMPPISQNCAFAVAAQQSQQTPIHAMPTQAPQQLSQVGPNGIGIETLDQSSVQRK